MNSAGNTRSEIASEIQSGFGQAFLAFLWANAGLVAVAGAWRGTIPLATSISAGVMLAGIPTLLWLRRATRGSTAVIASTSLACLVALLVAAFRHDTGMSLQIDMHMYFFACMAICVGWLNWRAILAFGLFVALHHTGVGLLDVGAVFPDGYTTGRLAIHAGIVALEGAVLIWIIRQVLGAIRATRNALAEAQLSAKQTEVLRLEAEGRAVADARRGAAFQQGAEQLRLKIQELGARADAQLAALNVTAGDLSGLASETMRQIIEAGSAAHAAAGFVRQVAHSAASLAEAERAIGRQAHQTSGSIRNAAATARDMNVRVEKLAEAARRIGDVVKLIDAVASQTNLLALNATIEAARAGAAGRGFAVVAQEVKTLAAEAARSTADIGELAVSIRDAAAGAMGSVTAIEAVMSEIDTAASTIAGAVDHQGAATEGISRNAAQMVRGTDLVVGAITGVTGAAEQTEGAASQVEEATRSVASALAELTRAVDTFLTDVLPTKAAA